MVFLQNEPKLIHPPSSMHLNAFQRSEHLALHSPLDLEPLCELVRQTLDLPPYAFDYENETEWGVAEMHGVEYNVSRPYEDSTLQEWDPSVSTGANVGISLNYLTTTGTTEAIAVALVGQVAQALADALQATVVHHRTWLCPGNNVDRNGVFAPRQWERRGAEAGWQAGHIATPKHGG